METPVIMAYMVIAGLIGFTIDKVMLLFESIRYISFSPTSAQRWETFGKVKTHLSCLEFQLIVGWT